MNPNTSAVIEYFQKTYGPVSKRALTEVTPSPQPISLHVVESGPGRPYLTLFTTGLSARKINTPRDQAMYSFAELFIQLPGGWFNDPIKENRTWPGYWMRRICRHAIDNNTWLGGMVATFPNGDPPLPLAPHTPCSIVMISVHHTIKQDGADFIRLYRMIPVYPQENDLFQSQGLDALYKAFDRQNTPFHVDVNRPSSVP